jgi:hypothetical protein
MGLADTSVRSSCASRLSMLKKALTLVLLRLSAARSSDTFEAQSYRTE